MKKAILLVAILAASSSVFAAFQLGMSARDVGTEVKARYTKGDNLAVIATAAKSVNVVASVLAPELILTGNPADKVFDAMIKAGYYPSDVESELVKLGADPTSFLPATAAGTGFTGNSFSNSRAATIGGGGNKSVSRT
jgi:hypothetical protein